MATTENHSYAYLDTGAVLCFGLGSNDFYRKNRNQVRLLMNHPGLYEIRVEKKFFRQTFYVRSFNRFT